ncbi:serum amyloid P-component [Perognathus longimembris pacificus]|uniref:serum amyloid P-component n=1 Tax=Perognathus longimembris pacificus TaxID=214514 RepID=UPI0020193E4D|nr:serum amyloid P-component [Perognathus longimembris pacificus]
MDKLMLLTLVFTSFLSEAFTQTDLRGKVFVFPTESSRDHVNLISQQEKPLQNFTLCLRAYSDLVRSYSLFSYNAKGMNNELLIYKERTGEYSLYIGGRRVTFKVMEMLPSPVHLCASWESSTGIAELWINGKPLVKKGLRQGYAIEAGGNIVLGQEQDSLGGTFDKSQSFVGEIGDLYMWDSVLSPEEILIVYQGSITSPTNPNVLNWQALHYEVKGYVIIKPLVWL